MVHSAMNPLAMSRLLLFLLGAAGTLRAQVAGADAMVFPAVELLANPSFETVQNGAIHPEGHRVDAASKDLVTVVNDYEQAFHGSICLRVENPTARWTWLGADAFTRAPRAVPVRLTVWMKGQGSAHFMLYYYDRQLLGTQKSPDFAVNSKEWQLYTWDMVLPATLEKDGQDLPLTKVAHHLRVKGNVSLDKLSFVRTADLPQVERRAFLAKADPRRPLLTIPKLKAMPVIDGRDSAGEWADASMTTGFHALGENAYADQQAQVQLGYDEECLYVAMQSRRGRVLRNDTKVRDKLWSKQHGAYEIWAESPKHGWVQILVTEFGGILMGSRDNAVSAGSAEVDFRCETRDSGAMQGGVLTFEKRVFTAELRIPFKSLGMGSPKAGDRLRINFTSDLAVDEGSQRKATDWLTWSPLGRFAETADYGEIVFGGSDLALRFAAVGDLNNAGIAFSGQVRNPGGRELGIASRVGTRGTPPSRTLFSQYTDLANQDDMAFGAEASVGVKRKEDLLFQANIGDLKSQLVLAALSIPFALRPSFSIDVVPDYAKGKLHVGLDVSKLNVLPATYVAEVAVTDKASEHVYVKTQMAARRGQAMPVVTLDLAEVNKGKPGDYVVQCFLLATAKGTQEQALAATTDYLRVPDLRQFVWLNNTWGISDKAPAPWQPVTVAGNQVKVTQREYLLSGSGLPAQVTALGEPLFARPPELRALVDGKQVSWAFREVRLLKTTDAAVTWAIEGRGGPLALKGTVRVEFDGFALWRVELSSEVKAVINRLWLAFPYAKDRSLYARGADFLTEFGSKHYSCLYNYQAGQEEEIVVAGHTPISLHGGWPWPQKFMNNIWIGDDHRGLALMHESDEFMFGERYVEIDQQKAENVLRYHFISEDVPIGPATGGFRYETAYQATPVKPRPPNPKLWHADMCPDDREKQGFKERVHAALLCYWALDPMCSATLARKYAPAATLRKMYGPGPRLTPYFGLNFVSEKVPEWPHFKGVWGVHPRSSCTFPNGKSAYTSTRSSFVDYMVWTAREVHDKLGFDGVYLDVSQPIPSRNPFHGSGYERNGKRYPTANIFALREAFKRIYNVYHSEGRNGTIYLHQTGLAATIGFADVTTEGESWLAEGKNAYSRLTPDIFRLKDMRIQYGTPYTWYTSFNYLYRAQKSLGKGNRIEAREILAYTLPHRVLPAVSDEAMYPVWDALDKWWTAATFVPYWSKRQIIASATKDVYASLLVKEAEGKALILCGNWSDESKAVSLQIAFAKLWDTRRVHARTVLGGGVPRLEGDDIRFSLAAKTYALIEVGRAGPK
jgi:hypothetical protein